MPHLFWSCKTTLNRQVIETRSKNNIGIVTAISILLWNSLGSGMKINAIGIASAPVGGASTRECSAGSAKLIHAAMITALWLVICESQATVWQTLGKTWRLIKSQLSSLNCQWWAITWLRLTKLRDYPSKQTKPQAFPPLLFAARTVWQGNRARSNMELSVKADTGKRSWMPLFLSVFLHFP